MPRDSVLVAMLSCKIRKIQRRIGGELGNGERKIGITGGIISERREKSQKKNIE